MNNEFPTPPEEIQRLAHEMSALRADFQGALSALNKMDKRLRTAYPNLPKPKKESSQSATAISSKSSEQLLMIFDELVILKREKHDQEFEMRLRALLSEDAIALASELGAGKGKKTTLKAALAGIHGRINETILLNQNRQVAERPPERN